MDEARLPKYLIKDKYESLYLRIDKLENKFNKASMMVIGDNLKYEAVKETNFRFKDIDTYEINKGLRNKDLRNCKFAGAQMFSSFCSDVSKLPHKVHFGGSNLNGVDLSDAKIFNISFENASMIGTKFTIRTTNPVVSRSNSIREIFPCDFTNAVLDGADIGIELPSKWNEATLDIFFNSSNNEYTLFNIFETISDEYSDVKINLLNSVIDSLISSGVEFGSPSFPAVQILNYIASKEIYLKDDKIDDFSKKLIASELLKANTKLNLVHIEPKTLALSLSAISQLKTEAELKELIIDFNGSFIQLIVLANNLDDEKIKVQARTLYSRYLSLDEVKPFVEKEEFGNGEQVPEWSDENYANYILINENKAIIIDHDNISKMLHLKKTKTDIKWDCFYFYKNNECQVVGNINYNELFCNDFRIFEASYRFDRDRASFGKLLSTLELDSYHDRFNSALSNRSVSDELKLVAAKDQLKLGKIFEKVLTRVNDSAKETMLKAEHYEKILSVFHLDSVDEKIKAQNLLSLAAIFSKYSSSVVFGTEQESPQILRDYAYALMSKAHELDPEVTRGHFDDWKNRLLGLNNAFTCTAVLSTAMIKHSKDHFNDVISKIIPPVWA